MNRGLYISLMLVLGFLGSFQALPNQLLAIVIFALVFLNFYKSLDTHIPILEITATIAALQWLLGPVLIYNYGALLERYDMHIESGRYFSFAIPGTCFYLAALRFFPDDLHQHEFLKNAREDIFFLRGTVLVIISFIAQFATSFAPGGLAFFVFLLTQLRYIGVIYLLYSRHQLRYLLIAVSLGALIIQSADSAMFHDLIIWVSLLACYWFHTNTWNAPKKAMLFTAGFACVFLIQIIKADYRQRLWAGHEASMLQIIYEKTVQNQEFLNPSTLRAASMRINQGWIISAVMLHVPLVEPHAEGETVKEAVISSIFPRFIVQDKKEAGGQENFRRFTGLILADSTSMGISVLGESYANFGAFGGTIFMFVWGLVYASFYRICIWVGRKYPTFIFWMPLIFYQAIKAETELVVVLNQLVKGTAVTFAAYYGLHKILPITKPETSESDQDFVEMDERMTQENGSPHVSQN